MKIELDSPSLTVPQEKLLLRFLDRVEKKHDTGKLVITNVALNGVDYIKMIFTPPTEGAQAVVAVESSFNKAFNLLAKFIGV